MNVRYECQSGTLRDDPTEDEIVQLLLDLDGVDNSYASLTVSNGGYIQVGGGPDEFTVEIREVGADRTFRQLKAGQFPPNPDERQLTIGGEPVTVRADQVLDLATTQRAFKQYLHDRRPDPLLSWTDMTDTFRD
jgi:hypothetical protein